MLTAIARSRIIGLLMGAALAMATASPVLAQHEPPRLGLTPIGEDGPYFDLTAEPGQALGLRVELANFGHDAMLARTFSADAYSIINGGFGADLFGEPASGTTLWLEYAVEEVRLEPGAAKIIGFNVTVPEDTAPGEYITALVAENAEPYVGPEGGGVAVEQVNRTVVAVAIDVPGPRDPALEIGAVTHKVAADASFVSFEVSNPGNVHLKPSGEFILRDGRGARLATASAVMDRVYAGTETLFEAPLAAALETGDYCAQLSLTDEETGVADSTECLAFTVQPPPSQADAPADGSTTIPVTRPAIDAVTGNPLPPALAAVLLALGVLAWILWRRRRRRRSGSVSDRALVPAGAGLYEPAWPAAEGLASMSAGLPGPSSEVPLRAMLERLPEITRAWLIGDDVGRTLVVEVARGTEPVAGSRLARLLEGQMGTGESRLRMRTRFVQGVGPVARATNGAEPFYMRAGPRTADADAIRPQPS